MAKLVDEKGTTLKEMNILRLGSDNYDSDDFDMILTIATSRNELRTMCDRLMSTGHPSPWLGLFHYIDLECMNAQTTIWQETDLLAAAYTKYYIGESGIIKIRRGDLFFMITSFVALSDLHPIRLSPKVFWDCVDIFKDRGWLAAATHLLTEEKIARGELHANSSIVDDEQVLHEKMFLSNTAN